MARKTKRKNIVQGVVHIHSTHNNTIVTFTDLKGNVVSWSSAGAIGYKGTKKSTPYAASLAADAASLTAKDHGIKEVRIELKGIGPGKDSARKQIEVAGFKVTQIKDVTPTPYNGTRPPRKIFKREQARK